MALLASEVARCKAELGYPLLSQANPYIGITLLFEQVVQPYIGAGATTTSSTAVAAVPEGELAQPKALTLADVAGFHTGDRVIVDVDGRQESATVRILTGVAITVDLALAHSGTYPVTVEGGESIVREILGRIRATKAEMGATFGEGGLKKVDEVEFYESGGTLFSTLGAQLMWWREELAAALGIQSVWQRRRAGAGRMSVY
jgi:hypothetical protein